MAIHTLQNFLISAVFSLFCSLAWAQSTEEPSPAEWAALARLPDWSGIWVPDVADQKAQAAENTTPWTPAAGEQISSMIEADVSGRPAGIFNDCLPEGMPSWMLISHNAFEALFTPGQVTLLGESDNNRMRRIYTDGRELPEDPDPSYHGYSVGHWEGDTLVVETTGILPEVYLAISEATGVRNGGDMHVRERFYLADPDTMHIDLEITAPHVLTETWETTRIYNRVRGFDIVEGICLQGNVDQVDEQGLSIFAPVLPE